MNKQTTPDTPESETHRHGLVEHTHARLKGEVLRVHEGQHRRDTPESELTGDGLRAASAFVGALMSSPVLGPDDDVPVPRRFLATILAALPNREAAPRRQYDSEPLDLREAAERVLDWADWQQPWNPAGDFDALRKATGRRLPEGDEPIGPRYYSEVQR